MDKKSRDIIAKQYDDLVKKHGVNIKSLFGNGKKYEIAHQRKKFQFVLTQMDNDDSLLDIGCGVGDLQEYCHMGGWKGKYTGIDISDGMVQTTRSRLNTKDVFQLDILEDSYDGRHDVVACISTLQQRPPYMDGDVYLEKSINRMFEICKKCVVFDVFSSKFVDYEIPDNNYISPIRLLDISYNLSNNLIIYNNFNPYQLMVVLYKEKLKGWKK